MDVKEIIADFKGCDPLLLDDIDYLRNLLIGLAGQVETSVCEAASHKYYPQGASVAIFVEESHLMISTWPEHGIAVFNCLLTHGPDPADLLNDIKRELRAKTVDAHPVNRMWDTTPTPL